MFDLNPLGPNSIREAVARARKGLLEAGCFFYGRRVVELPTHRSPKLKLSPDCPVSDEFRAEMDAWLVERFGYRDVSIFQPGMAYLFGDEIVMHAAGVARLRSMT